MASLMPGNRSGEFDTAPPPPVVHAAPPAAEYGSPPIAVKYGGNDD